MRERRARCARVSRSGIRNPIHAVILKIANALMALLFAGGVVVQLNDPDPLRWMAIYLSALAISVLWALRVTVPAAVPLAIGGVALVWGAAVTAGRPEFEAYRHMFGAWEMKSVAVEEAREGTGLFLIAFWMLILAVRARRDPRRAFHSLRRH